MKRKRQTPPPPTRRQRLWQRPLTLALILFAGALLVRLVNLNILASNPYFDAPVMDEQYHQIWATQIVAGQGGEYVPFYRAPGYAYLLATIYRVAGVQITAGRVLSSILGALTVALTLLLAWRLVGRGPAIAAALALSFYPMALYFDGLLLGTSLETLLCVAALLALVSARTASGQGVAHRWTILLGIILGLAIITRPLTAVLMPVAAAFLLDRSRPGAWRRPALLLIACAMPVAAVTAVNVVGGGERVLIAWNGGINFFLGNNPAANGWSATAPELRPAWWSGYLDAIEVAARELGHEASPAEVSSYWFGRGRAFIAGQPLAWAALMARKLYLLVNGVEISNNQSIAAFSQYSPLLRFPLLGFALLIILAAPQLVRRRCWREPIGWFVAVYGFAVVLFFVTSRYRMPLVPLLMILAVQTIFEWIAIARAGRWRSLMWPASIALAVALVSATDWVGAYQPDAADHHFSLGNRSFQAGAYERALVEYERAFRAPGTASRTLRLQALNNIASTHLREERSAEARRYLEQSIEIEPTTEACARLGWSYYQEGRYDAARAALDRALAIQAGNPEALYYLGHVQWKQEVPLAALQSWEQAATLHPDPSLQQVLYYALASLYVETGSDPARALHYLDRITQAFPDLERMRAVSETALRE